jgi:carbonic anhydrase
MDSLDHLFAKNLQWASSITEQDPSFFPTLAKQQSPEYLWIGCSDSRVPANEIVGLLPGELFVHRNVANVILHTDFNCLSVLQYAVDVLKVKHIIVCGHYGCGGVRASIENASHGLIDNWLRNIQDIYKRNTEKFTAIPSLDDRVDLLCELNVIEQVERLKRTTVVTDAWRRKQPLTIHGWIYGITDGLLKDLKVSVNEHSARQTW